MKKGGIGGVAMLLAGYVVLSYVWEYDHISKNYLYNLWLSNFNHLPQEWKYLIPFSQSCPSEHDRWRKYHWGASAATKPSGVEPESLWFLLLFQLWAVLLNMWLLWPINKIHHCLELSEVLLAGRSLAYSTNLKLPATMTTITNTNFPDSFVIVILIVQNVHVGKPVHCLWWSWSWDDDDALKTS